MISTGIPQHFKMSLRGALCASNQRCQTVSVMSIPRGLHCRCLQRATDHILFANKRVQNVNQVKARKVLIVNQAFSDSAADVDTGPATEVLFQTSTEFDSLSVVKFHDSEAIPGLIRGSTVLFDATGSILSMYREETELTKAYWDHMCILPGLIPDDPVGILGLGAGTLAHLVHHFFPRTSMVGWELDGALLVVARMFMGLKDLEESGVLEVIVADALPETATVPGGLAGIAVDLFAGGGLLGDLTEDETWKAIQVRLKPGGRVVANLGNLEAEEDKLTCTGRQALAAMSRVFPEGQLAYIHIKGDAGDMSNIIALTGPDPLSSLEALASSPLFPQALKQATTGWQLYDAETL